MGPACPPRVGSVLWLSQQGWQKAHSTSSLASYKVIPVGREQGCSHWLTRGSQAPIPEAACAVTQGSGSRRVGTRGSLRGCSYQRGSRYYTGRHSPSQLGAAAPGGHGGRALVLVLQVEALPWWSTAPICPPASLG